MKLFVYGTLKRGYGNNRLLEGAKFLGEATTQKHYSLVDCGFPKAVPSFMSEKIPFLPVRGEVFEVNGEQLSMCDRLEGHPNWYERRNIDVTYDDGSEDQVMIYEMDHTHESRPSNIYNNIYNWGR